MKLEKVEVTGSRLRRTDYESAQPVVTLTRADIDRTGLTDLSQILRQLSVAGNDSLNTQTQKAALTLGETNLDLRNLGAQHTLILVNGRRWITGLVSSQPSIADLNTIPTAIIERVEILKDGASAVYGSDAIGGVVNVITRKDYSGIGWTSQLGGFFEQNDGGKQQHTLSWGLAGAATSVFLNLSYTQEYPAYVDRRPFTASPIPTAGITRWGRISPDGRFVFVATPTNAALYDCPNAQADIVGPIVEGTPAPSLPGLGSPGGFIGSTRTIPAGLTVCGLKLNPGATGGNPGDYHQQVDTNINDRYNYFQGQILQQPSKRGAVYTQVTQKLMDHLRFNFEGFYNARNSTGNYGDLAIYGGNLIRGTQPNGYASVANSRNPFQQDIGNDSSCAGNIAGDPSPTCTGVGIGSGYWAIRMPRDGRALWHFNDRVYSMRLGGALEGDFNLLDRLFSWETGYFYTSNKATEYSPLYRYDRLSLAMGPDANCAGDCVPFEPFKGQAGVTQEMLDYLYQTTIQKNWGRQDMALANISTDLGNPFGLLGGAISIATGVEFRRDQYASEPDALIEQGLTFLNAQVPTRGQTYAREAFMEIGVPLVKDVILLRDLDLDVAGRISNYPKFGTVKTGKAGLRWKPFEDVLLRGTISTGFRAPNIGELYLGPSQSFDPVVDPCAADTQTQTQKNNCGADNINQALAQNGGTGQAYDVWKGNPDLKPEKSRNLTYGLVFSPRWIPDLNLNVDFYRIDLDNFIATGLGQFFLDSCYSQTQRAYCGNIHRNGAGALVYIDSPYFNYSAIKTQGIDGGIDYALPLPRTLGRFKLTLDASYLTKYDQILPVPGQADQVFGSVGQEGLFNGWPRWKADGNITWKMRGFSASWATSMRYKLVESCGDGLTPTFTELGLCSNPSHDADGAETSTNLLKTTFYHDVQIGYEIGGWTNATITAGVNNVLNQDPPISYSTIGSYFYNYDPNHYEMPGRFGYVRLSMKF